MSSQQNEKVLSLQELCKLHVLFRLEEFPGEILALLPLWIRRELFLSLSLADILHLDGTSLFNDVAPSHQMECRQSEARQLLTKVILGGAVDSDFNNHLAEVFFSLNLKEAGLSCFNQMEYNRKSIDDLMIPVRDYYRSFKRIGGSVFLPTRSLQYVSLHGSKYSQFQLTSKLLDALLTYCNGYAAPSKLKINCYYFVDSLFWRDYQMRKKQLVSSPTNSSLKMDPVIPFLQNFLSSVEVLELGTQPVFVNDAETLKTVPYVLLYNIITSKQPRLKHLKVNGYGNAADTCWMLSSVAELLCKASTRSPFFYCSGTELASTAPAPYLLEGLSVDLGCYWDEPKIVASEMVSTVESIVCFQLHNLKRIEILDPNEASFDVPEYRILLSSSLTHLLKQPQFHLLSVGKCPLPEAYELIEAFLSTPTIHEQYLRIEGIGDGKVESDEGQEEEVNKNEGVVEEKGRRKRSTTEVSKGFKVMKMSSPIKDGFRGDELTQTDSREPTRPPLCQPFPETNGLFKCLDLGQSSSCVYAWLFSHPVLKLKKLVISTQGIDLVALDMGLQVENVGFHPTMAYNFHQGHLEKFVVSNPTLKQLEFDWRRGPQVWCSTNTLPTLTHCLSQLNQQETGLQELQMKSLNFRIAGLKEFFSQVRDLSQRCGTILILLEPISVCTEQAKCLLRTLSEQFQEKKIKRIILDSTPSQYSLSHRRSEDPVPQLRQIADEVISFSEYMQQYH